MNFPNEYINFLVHFHGDRDYFECHEILEDYWKRVDNKNKKSIWVGFILLAVANYHHRRANNNGAYRTLNKALQILPLYKEELKSLGLDSESLLIQLHNNLIQIKDGQPYQSMDLPIYSHELKEECKKRCKELHLEWKRKSDYNDLNILHRHLKRDRSDVIKNRREALENKTNKRQ